MMIIPYLTKFKCQSCDKWHRLTFKQWKKVLSKWWKTAQENGEYIATQKQFSDADTAFERLQTYKKVQIVEKETLRYKLGKWIINRVK